MSIYKVSQIARYVREYIERDRILADLYLSGEVSNLTKSAAGHYYFTLKDGDAQIRCVMFKPATGAEALTHGAAVVAHGRVSFYQQRGDLQFYADLVQPEGVGELHMEFLRLKAKLEEAGLFDPTRKRSLPAFPKRIAVITSRTGAVWHDIQKIIGRRYPLVEIVLVHAAVQGDQAPGEVVAGLKLVNRTPGLDVVIVARGGGSMEELWAFNDERVARAIYGCRVPVVSAVGHETDFTIADYVADLRAPTPSAAAEIVVPDRRELKDRVRTFEGLLHEALTARVEGAREQVRTHELRLARLAPDVAMRRQRVDELTRAATAVMRRELALWREQIKGRMTQLGALHPGNTLNRGYALVEQALSGALVTKRAQVASGDALYVQVSDGRFAAQVSGDGPPPPRRAAKRGKRATRSEEAAGQQKMML
ncbi:MAG: exodeoxyribonuclease VII large subunit [Chloroflexi bacterium]|nr:exodeoxyribonuclease VII large subunit [Chloroflexota bacterium]